MLLIKNAIIHVGNGKIIKGYDILIENKTIKKIEKDIKAQCDILDASGKEVFPGFIDPVNNIGCIDLHNAINDTDENSDPINVEMNIKYSFNPAEIEIQKLYKVGVTTIGAVPGNSNIIGGQIAVFKTVGNSLKDMLVKECVGIKGSVTNLVKNTYGEKDIFPKTKMGIFNLLDNTLKEAKYSSKVDKKNILLRKLLNKEIKFFVSADTKSEIDALINVLNKYEVEFVICNAYEADKSINKIQFSNSSVVIGDLIYLSKGINYETNLKKICDLSKEGKLISLTMTPETYACGREHYLWNAIEVYKSGVSSEDVITMMTLNPAKMLKVDNILGSIEIGKNADLTIYSNNPIEYYDARVLYTIVNGKIVYRDGGEN